MADTILKIVGPPSIIAQSDGNGGAIIIVRARNHPADGTRILFSCTQLIEFLRSFAERLRIAGRSEVFPGQVQLLIESKDRHSGIIDANKASRLIMFKLVGWKNPDPKSKAGEPPTLVFDQATAQKLFAHIAEVTGKIL